MNHFNYIIVASMLVVGLTTKAQSHSDEEKPDTSKSEIVIDIIRNTIKLEDVKNLQRLYLSMDLRANKLLSDGMSYTPTTQDTALTYDIVTAKYICSQLAKPGLKVELVSLHDIGKVNRESLVFGLRVDDGNTKTNGRFGNYIEIGQPIDGWDIVEIIQNNYWKNRYGKDKTGALQSTLYVPVVYGFYDERSEHVVIKHYLDSYSINAQTGKLNYKFLNRTILKIE